MKQCRSCAARESDGATFLDRSLLCNDCLAERPREVSVRDLPPARRRHHTVPRSVIARSHRNATGSMRCSHVLETGTGRTPKAPTRDFLARKRVHRAASVGKREGGCQPMRAPKTVRRTRIAEDWQPDAKDKDFAESLGVDWATEGPAFADHHAMHGNLMADWHAAWRTWCRNCVRFGRASGQRTMPLFSVVAGGNDDDYGAKAWARTLRDAVQDKMPDGSTVLCLGGYDAAGTAVDVCRACGLPPTWRGNLEPVADWLRQGVEPDAIVGALRGVLQGKPPAYHANRVLDRAQNPARNGARNVG